MAAFVNKRCVCRFTLRFTRNWHSIFKLFALIPRMFIVFSCSLSLSLVPFHSTFTFSVFFLHTNYTHTHIYSLWEMLSSRIFFFSFLSFILCYSIHFNIVCQQILHVSLVPLFVNCVRLSKPPSF